MSSITRNTLYNLAGSGIPLILFVVTKVNLVMVVLLVHNVLLIVYQVFVKNHVVIL